TATLLNLALVSTILTPSERQNAALTQMIARGRGFRETELIDLGDGESGILSVHTGGGRAWARTSRQEQAAPTDCRQPDCPLPTSDCPAASVGRRQPPPCAGGGRGPRSRGGASHGDRRARSARW